MSHPNEPRRRSDRHRNQDNNKETDEKQDETIEIDAEKPKREQKTKEQKRRSRKNKKRSEKKTRIITLKRAIISIGAVFVLALIAYTTILYGGSVIADDEKLIITPPTTIETEDGEIIWFLYDEFRLPVDIDQIPKHVQDAFIAIEDKRFYTHTGVDLRSIVRAVYRDIIARDKVEGASTITQQLAKNMFLTNDKSWWRKIKEAMIALYLEREFTKEQILEMYLNVIYFGQGQYGLEAASNKYFHKSVEELTLEEGALLAGIIKAPNGYSPINHPEKALNRRNVVLDSTEEQGYITKKELKTARSKELSLNISTRSVNPAHHTI